MLPLILCDMLPMFETIMILTAINPASVTIAYNACRKHLLIPPARKIIVSPALSRLKPRTGFLR